MCAQKWHLNIIEVHLTRANENYQQHQRYHYLEQALTYNMNRQIRAQDAFNKWKMAKDKIVRDSKNCADYVDKIASDPIEREKNFRAWESRKNEEERARKEMVKSAEIKRQCEAQRRTALAKQEYEKWLRTAKTRPKAVPMGQGLLSKSTSSKLPYIITVN